MSGKWESCFYGQFVQDGAGGGGGGNEPSALHPICTGQCCSNRPLVAEFWSPPLEFVLAGIFSACLEGCVESRCPPWHIRVRARGPKFSFQHTALPTNHRVSAAAFPFLLPSCALTAIVLSVREGRVEPTTLPDEHAEPILSLFQ